MIRLNLVLLLALVASAFFLVHTQYESRRVYTQLDKARSLARRLESEREQLEVQKRAEATSARIQALAAQHLQMRPANPAITHYATWTGVAATPGRGAAAESAAGASPAGGASATAGGQP